MDSKPFIDDAFRLVTMLAPTPALSAALIREQLPEPDPIEAALEIARRRREDDQWNKFNF